MSIEKLTDERINDVLKSLIIPGPYAQKSTLRELVESRVTDLARDIATELVRSEPRLEQIIRQRTSEVIAQALRDDSYLSTVIVSAVARALGQLVRDERIDET